MESLKITTIFIRDKFINAIDKKMTPMKKRYITGIVAIVLSFGFFSGCTEIEEKRFTDSITVLEPDLGDDWVQWNYTYEENYNDKRDVSPIFGLIIPEYLLMEYNGAHMEVEKKSMNIIVLKLNSVKDTIDVYQRYKDNMLQWNGIETGNETIGDESWIGRAPSNPPLLGVMFRRVNCLVLVSGFIQNNNMTVYIDIAKEMEGKITSLSS